MNANALDTLPTISVSDYGASGSDATGSCSASAGSVRLTCSIDNNDFHARQWIRLKGAGPVPQAFRIQAPPIVTPDGSGTGPHTFCYVVSTADPFNGVTNPSPQTCVANEPDLSLTSVANALSTTDHGAITDDDGPAAVFLWYVSEDGGPFQLVSVSAHLSAAVDVGQRPTSRGGWPIQLPVGNPNISSNEDFFSQIVSVNGSQITLADPVVSSVDDSMLAHDDTDAVESAVLAGVAQGGGVIQFGPGVYNLLRPYFHGSYGVHSHQTNGFYWEGFSSLYLPDNSPGNISLQGVGPQTVLRTSADHNGSASLLDFGNPVPPYLPEPPIAIQEVQKGSITVQLSDSSASSPQPGDDIELFTGNFSYTAESCQANIGEPGTCHFSELNTVVARNGDTLTLAYPTSKRYYDDGSSSFGLTVRTHLPTWTVPHHLALQHMTLDTYNNVYNVGNVIGLWINDVHITGYVSHGPFAGGSKRDITIENSSWGTGAGDGSWNGTNEMDKCTNFILRNNTFSGYAAATAEGLSTGARLYVTEGSSLFTLQNNTFVNSSLLTQSTTEDAIVQNTFHNGEANVGFGYDDNFYNFTVYHNQSYLSFASQENALIDSNVFTEDASIQVPIVILLGDYTNGVISNNTITDWSNRNIPAITSYGGKVVNNLITFSNNTQWSSGIALVPDPSPVGPGAPFDVEFNTVTAPHISAGIFLIDPGLTATTPICIRNNTANLTFGQAVANFAPSNFNLTCADVQ